MMHILCICYTVSEGERPMMEHDDIRFLEEHLPFFRNLSASQKQYLVSQTEKICYQKQIRLSKTATSCPGLYLLKKGEIRAYIASETGRELTMFRLFDGDLCLLSASCLFKNIRFQLEIAAYPDTEVYRIESGVYERLQKESREVLEQTNAIMETRLTEAMWILEQTLFSRFSNRLAGFLIDQAAAEGSDILHLTHEEIAQHLASAREVVSRMLKYFQNEGIVKGTRNRIEIIDRKKLEEYCEK